jgi:hypothetical protein
MANGDKTVPNLENATPSFLIDEIGRMRVEAARLQFLDGIYKSALKARVTDLQLNGGSFIKGEKFVGDYEQKTQERVDTAAVREHFKNDPEILAKLIKIVTFKQLNTKPNPNGK